MAIILEIIKSARPTHWVKNLALFVGLFFSGSLLNPALFSQTVWAFVIFSAAASSCYLFNDVIDRKSDRLHPIKRKRGVAKGTLPPPVALLSSSIVGVGSLFLASFISPYFFAAVLMYIILQILYTVLLKGVPIIDIFSIAAGFMLRVWAGAFVANAHLSVWFLLCVISLSLLLATGKRKAELAILTSLKIKKRFLYPPTLLDSYVAVFATSSFLSWALFTFFTPSPPLSIFLPLSVDLPLTLAGIGKWLMLTIPVVIFGIMRYLQIVYGKTLEAETPERTFIKDKPLLLSVLIWAFLIFSILYLG